MLKSLSRQPWRLCSTSQDLVDHFPHFFPEFQPEGGVLTFFFFFPPLLWGTVLPSSAEEKYVSREEVCLLSDGVGFLLDPLPDHLRENGGVICCSLSAQFSLCASPPLQMVTRLMTLSSSGKEMILLSRGWRCQNCPSSPLSSRGWSAGKWSSPPVSFWPRGVMKYINLLLIQVSVVAPLIQMLRL